MIRISKLLRVTNLANKLPLRGGPGWDRPDVPPSQTVETDRRVIPFSLSGPTNKSYTPSLTPACPNSSSPNLKSTKALSLKLSHNLPPSGVSFSAPPSQFMSTARSSTPPEYHITLSQNHRVNRPTETEYYLTQTKRLNEEKLGLKWAKENPFGISKP